MPGRSNLFTALGIAALVAGLLACLGFWQSKSPRYWRAYAQSSLLYAAEKAPTRPDMYKMKKTLLKAALSIHLAGVSPDEIARAATVLQRIGNSRDAAVLWLGLSHIESLKGNEPATMEFAKRSFQAAPNLEALVALVVLTRNQPGEQRGWIQRIQAGFPQHDLSIAWRCRDSVISFQVDPPNVCEGAHWVRTWAWQARHEDLRLQAEIQNLPGRAAGEIAKSEAAVRRHLEELPRMQQRVASLTGEKNNLGWNAFGEVVADSIPLLPKPGDTLEKYVVREAACALKWINPFCVLAAIGNALEKKDKNDARLAKEIRELREWIGLKVSIVNSERSNIQEWRSNRPLERLMDQRSRLLGQFQQNLTSGAYQRYRTHGVSASVAVSSILAAPGDWMKTATATWNSPQAEMAPKVITTMVRRSPEKFRGFCRPPSIPGEASRKSSSVYVRNSERSFRHWPAPVCEPGF